MKQCLGGIGATCSKPPIQSHTIARRWLRSIARNNHVYIQSHNVFDDEKAARAYLLPLVGINKATAYPIFCSEHDNELFRELEQREFSPTTETAAQLHFRAICREAYTKVGANVLTRTIPVAHNHPRAEELIGFAMGNAAALRDVSIQYHNERHRIAQKTYDHTLQFYTCSFEHSLPFCFVCAFFPEIDFRGQKLADLSDISRTPPALAASCFNDGGRGHLVLTWDRGGEEARAVAQSFHAVPQHQKANAALTMGLEFIENTAFAPHWWEGLGADARKRLHFRLATAGSPLSPIRPPSALLNIEDDAGPSTIRSWKSNDGTFSILRVGS